MNPDSTQKMTPGDNTQGQPIPDPSLQPAQRLRTAPVYPERTVTPHIPERTPEPQREAAANIIRSQIDTLYNRPTSVLSNSTQPEAENPYQRTMKQEMGEPAEEQWKAYHSAWQQYYQKYYETYYHQQHQAREEARENELKRKEQYFSSQVTATPAVLPTENQKSSSATEQDSHEDETVSKQEALHDLRRQLLQKVQVSAHKVRHSRHFIPVIAGLFVIAVFVFLQYNSLITGTVAAYVSPGMLNEQNIVVDPNDTSAVSPDPRIIIPKINVDVPVSYGIGNDYNSQMAAMQNGLADFAVPGASSVPGQIGNTVLAGHSSNDLFDKGDYKFIFSQLDKLGVGDTIYADYQGVRYTYAVTGTKVVDPTDVAALVYPTDKPILTLLTCTPLGTSRYRLLVIADQISPDPSTAKPAPATSGSSATTIPGANGPTVFEKLFGSNG